MALLPEEQHAEFKDLYEGGMVVKRIKTFLATPGEVNQFFDAEAETSVFDYWQHPYETAFHTSLIEQRQALALARQQFEVAGEEAEVTLVERIGRGLPRMIVTLRERGRDRPPLEVADEYDVQYLLEGTLRSLFDDVRPEDPSPSRAGASTRIDFVLKREEIVVEAKMTREGRRTASGRSTDRRYRALPVPPGLSHPGGDRLRPRATDRKPERPRGRPSPGFCRYAGPDRGLQLMTGSLLATRFAPVHMTRSLQAGRCATAERHFDMPKARLSR